MFGRAVEDICVDCTISKYGYNRDEFTFWETYDWLVEYAHRLADAAGADPDTVTELLVYEFEDEFILDFFPRYGLEPIPKEEGP